jgi:hypothetical protein
MNKNEITAKIAEHYKHALELRKQGHDADEIIQACIRWTRQEKIDWSKVKGIASGAN